MIRNDVTLCDICKKKIAYVKCIICDKVLCEDTRCVKIHYTANHITDLNSETLE